MRLIGCLLLSGLLVAAQSNAGPGSPDNPGTKAASSAKRSANNNNGNSGNGNGNSGNGNGNSGNNGNGNSGNGNGNSGNNGNGNSGNGNGNSGNGNGNGQPDNPGNSGNHGPQNGPHHSIEWLSDRSDVEDALLADGTAELRFLSHADLENIVVWLTPSLEGLTADPEAFDMLADGTEYAIQLSLEQEPEHTMGGTAHLRSGEGNSRSFAPPFPLRLKVDADGSEPDPDNDDPPEIEAVVNSANYHGDAVTPGSIVSLFGRGMGPHTPMGGHAENGRFANYVGHTQVTFNGIPAALLVASDLQVNAVVPEGVDGEETVEIVLTFEDGVSLPLTVPVHAVSPALFTVDGSGEGQAAALNEDWTLNSAENPAPAGSVVMLFGNGFGRWNESISEAAIVGSELPTPAAAVSATVDGIPARVVYVGGSPGSISALVQINLEIPEGVSSGDVSVVITVGGESTSESVTIAVE